MSINDLLKLVQEYLVAESVRLVRPTVNTLASANIPHPTASALSSVNIPPRPTVKALTSANVPVVPVINALEPTKLLAPPTPTVPKFRRSPAIKGLTQLKGFTPYQDLPPLDLSAETLEREPSESLTIPEESLKNTDSTNSESVPTTPIHNPDAEPLREPSKTFALTAEDLNAGVVFLCNSIPQLAPRTASSKAITERYSRRNSIHSPIGEQKPDHSWSNTPAVTFSPKNLCRRSSFSSQSVHPDTVTPVLQSPRAVRVKG